MAKDISIKLNVDLPTVNDLKRKMKNSKIEFTATVDTSQAIKSLNQLGNIVKKLDGQMTSLGKSNSGFGNRFATETNKITKSTQSALTQAEKLYTKIEKLKSQQIKSVDSNISNAIGKYITSLEKDLNQVYSKLNSVEKSTFNSFKQSQASLNEYNTSLAQIKRNNTETANALRTIKSLYNEQYKIEKQLINAGDKEAAVLREQLSLVKSKTNETLQQYRQQGLVTQEVEKTLSAQKQLNSYKIAQTTAKKSDNAAEPESIYRTMDIFNFAQQSAYAVAGLVSQLNEVDQAITRVTKVANAPQKDIDSFTKSIYDNATSVGKSASEYADAVELWITTGKSLKESTSLAKDSVMGAFVGNVDVQDMVRYMAVPLNAFKSELLSSKDIINTMNAVSNKNAIEMNDLGAAYSKAAQQVSTTKTSFSQLTGLITGAQEATRAGGDSIGRAIKTISLNLSNLGNGFTGMTKSRGDWFKNTLGINLKDANGELKSTYEIMKELAKIWNTLDTNQQQQATYYAAGKEHATVFTGLMNNWSTVEKAYKQSENQINLTTKTQGSAFKEFSKQQQSVEFHLKALINTWQKLSNTIVGGRDGVNALIDGATSFLKILQAIADNDKAMNVAKFVAMASALVLARRAASGFINITKNFATKELSNSYKALLQIPTSIRGAGSAVTTSTLRAQQAIDRLKASLIGLNNTTDTIVAKTSGYNLNKSSSTTKGKTVKVSTNALNSATNLGVVSANSISKVSSSAAKGASSVSKFSRVLGVLGGTLGTVLGLASGVGVVLDVLAIGFTLLNAVGIDPFEKISRAINPAKANLDDMSKSLDNVTKKNNELNKSLKDNRVFNGTAASDNKAISNMYDLVNTNKKANDNKMATDDFNALKKQFNTIAKENGLDLKIKFNNYDVISEQLANLDSKIKALNKEKVSIGIKDINEETKNLGKINNQDNFKIILSNMDSYQEKLSKLNNDYNVASIALSQGVATQEQKNIIDNYKKNVEELNAQYTIGNNLAEAWSTKQGKKIAQAWEESAKAIKKQMSNLSKAINDDVYSKADYNTMSPETLNKMQVAQAATLQKATYQANLLDSINKKRKEGKTLNTDELEFLASKSKNLQSVTKDTTKWSDTENKAYDALTEKINKNKTAITERMRTILEANGKSQSSIDAIINAYEKSNASYIKMMAKQGDLGKSMLGVTAEFATKYGDNWGKALSSIQTKIDKLPDNKITRYAFVDESTGLVKSSIIDELNELPEKKMIKFGISYDKYGGVDVNSIVKGLKNIPEEKLVKMGVIQENGSIDIVSFMDKLINKTKQVPTEVRMQFVANTNGFDKEAKDIIKDAIKADGFKATVQYIADTKMFGDETNKVIKWINSIKGTKADPTISLKTDEFIDQVKNVQNKFKDLNKDSNITVQMDSQKAQSDIQACLDTLKKIDDQKVYIKGDTSDLDKAKNSAIKELQKLRDKVVNIEGKDSLTVKAIDAYLNLQKLPKKKTTKVEVKGDAKKAQKTGEDDGKAYASSYKQSIQSNLNNDDAKKTKDNKSKSYNKGKEDGKSYSQGYGDGVKETETKSTKKQSTKKKNKVNTSALLGLSGNKNVKSTSADNERTQVINIKVKGDGEKALKNIESILGKKGGKRVYEIEVKKKSIQAAEKALKSLINKKATIKITAKDNTKSGVNSAKASLKKISTKSVSIKASNKTKSGVHSAKASLSKLSGKTVSIKASNKTKSGIESAQASIGKVKGKTVSVKAEVSGKKAVDNLRDSINALHDKSVNVTTNKITTKSSKRKNSSVAIDSSIVTGINPAKSLSVLIDNPSLLNTVENPTESPVIAVRDSSESIDDSRVDESYWRYMGTELYTGGSLDAQIAQLEAAITMAGEDMEKLIRLSQQKIDLDNKQINYQNQMKNAYQNQMNSILSQLRGYGFGTNGNQITNLSHAQSFTGDTATKVNELLSTYQSVYQNLLDIDNKITDLNTDKYQQEQNIKDYQESIESEKIEKLQRQLELLTTAIDNSRSIIEKRNDFIGDHDYKLQLDNKSLQLTTESNALKDLVAQFNALSTMSFSTPEQAEKIGDSLDSLKSQILESADSIIELKQAINDIQINAITEDLSKFTSSLNTNINRLKNNITNLQEGLLDGTSFDDLMSSQFDILDISQKTEYEKIAQDRLDLEKQLDSALDAFAQKNIDRTAQVANAQLQIEQNKYQHIIDMANQAASGNTIEIGDTTISAPSISNDSGKYVDSISINGSKSNQYMEISKQYAKQMIELRAKYNEELSKATTEEEKQRITQEMIISQIDMQRSIYEEIIKADQQAIKDLEEKAKNNDLTSEQLQKINEQISSYEDEIMDAQNSIKEAVKSRFDYENQLMQDQITQYKNYADTIGNLVSIGGSLNISTETQGKLYDAQYNAAYKQYKANLDALTKLQEQQKQYSTGSYEYNLIQSEIDEYRSTITSLVSSMLDITKDRFSNALNGIQENIEKAVNGGKTSSDVSFAEDIWYSGVDKELQLEVLRQKIKAAQLEDSNINKQLELLDAQKDMSKIQADLLDKRIDVAVAEQKLENAKNNRTVQTLTKDENGRYQWTYVAKQEDIDSAQSELTQAQQALEQYKKEQKSKYISKIEEVISGAKDGSLTPEQVKDRLKQLNDAYKIILDDIPDFDYSTIDEILKAYDDYVAKNEDIIKDYGKDTSVGTTEAYEQLFTDFAEQFKSVGKEVGEIIGKEVKSILSSTNYDNLTSDDSGMVIQKLILELPNVDDSETFMKTLFNDLPALAKQKVNSK